MNNETLSIPEQIKEALDGRTQRWLSIKIGLPESDLSNKINGKMVFTKDEVLKINEALNCDIKIPDGD